MGRAKGLERKADFRSWASVQRLREKLTGEPSGTCKEENAGEVREAATSRPLEVLTERSRVKNNHGSDKGSVTVEGGPFALIDHVGCRASDDKRESHGD